MISIVNDKYKYILFYSAKAGSTSSRLLYLLLHDDEFTSEQRKELNGYHNLNEVHAYDRKADYSKYSKFLITRNPYSRAVSAYLDQYVFAQHAGVKKMISGSPPAGSMPNNFLEFLEYLKRVPDSKRDGHFQTQAYFANARRVLVKPSMFDRLFKVWQPKTLILNFSSDIRNFTEFTRSVYGQVFKADSTMLAKAEVKIVEIKKSNSSFYGSADFDDAGLLSVADLDALVLSPKPQDFYRSERAQRLVEEIYADDFRLFDYTLGDLPSKAVSAEVDLIPSDFDWQAYIKFNPDLPIIGIDSERTAVRHYLEFGRFEPRAFMGEAPAGFDWRRYIELHEDLQAAGIDNERDAIAHYLSYGIREERQI